MTNDREIEVLIRRYGKGAAQNAPVDHPDADELNAFAEGAIPAATRQRYVSHFADCDDCRKLVTQLTATAGAAAEARLPASEPVGESWWRRLGALFSPPVLRYGAFAAVLLAVVGIAFVVWRRPDQRNAELIAQNQPQSDAVEAVKPASVSQPEIARDTLAESPTTKAVPQPTVSSSTDEKKLEPSTVNPAAPPKPADALAENERAPSVAAARAAEQPRADTSPSYAPPPPPSETFGDVRRRDQANVGAVPGGPRRNESYDKYKTVDRKGELSKEGDEDRSRVKDQSGKDDKPDETERAQTSSGVASVRGRRQEMRVEARKSEPRSEGSEEAETRSVGGRKFQRQGNAWVDAKFKSSMSVRTIARGSEDFDKLDSGLRSIANQLSGEIVVVWKGKAYRIR